MTRQAAKPSVDRVHRLGHGRKITALNDFLDEAKLFGRDVGILVPYRDRSCDISLAGIICAEFLKRQVGVGRLVCRIGIDRSEEHTSELQSLMRISYAVFCLKKKKKQTE